MIAKPKSYFLLLLLLLFLLLLLLLLLLLSFFWWGRGGLCFLFRFVLAAVEIYSNVLSNC